MRHDDRVGISVDELVSYVERAVDRMADIVGGLGDDLANRRPALPGANSPYAILRHCLEDIATFVNLKPNAVRQAITERIGALVSLSDRRQEDAGGDRSGGRCMHLRLRAAGLQNVRARFIRLIWRTTATALQSRRCVRQF